MKKARFAKRQAALINGWRSGFESDINELLVQQGIDGEYEKHKISYTIPQSEHNYTPDFKLPNGIFIETKGRFVTADRSKHILIKKLENLLKQTRTLHFLENQQPFLEISFYLLVLIKISQLKTFMKK